MKKMYMLEWILDECKQDPYLDFKILIFKIRIRPKTDRIQNPKHWMRLLLLIVKFAAVSLR